MTSTRLGCGLAVFGALALGCSSDDTAPAALAGTGGSAQGTGGGSSGAGGVKDASPDGAGGTSGTGGAGTGGAPLVPTDGSSYADASLWLCRNTSDDVCHQNLDATIVNVDGTTTVEPHVFATNAPIDCFYVYPTISADKTPNSDFIPGEGEEINVTKQQAARLTSVCNVYAPMYRQTTLGALFPGAGAGPSNPAIAYGDVLNAWNYFQNNWSKGRPFVLIGHSQGAGMLKRLVKDHIDGDAATRARLVSAFLIGGNVVVPDGKDVGGDFQNVPLCRADTQRGCVVAYSTFRATAPPTTGALFGAPPSATSMVACNNPAALTGGAVNQKPYFGSTGGAINLGSIHVTTPFVTLPDFLQGECVVENGFSYMKITILSDGDAGPRPDVIGGDLTAGWGLHLIDVNIAMGDIVDLVTSQVGALPDN